jgi:hypothetical protein
VAGAMLAVSMPTFADSSHDPAITEGLLNFGNLTHAGGTSLTTCPGEVIQFTFIASHNGTVAGQRSFTVNGGSCSNVVLPPDSVVNCTVTMNGDQSIGVF